MTSLYIHIPFCERKCLYCSFVVAVGQQHRVDDYLECLEREAERYQRSSIETIYIGGGTPTFLNAHQLERLFGIIKSRFRYLPSSEIAVEANPEGITLEKAETLRELGVNRISLGVQSFHDRYLKFLGRSHDSLKAVTAFNILREAGFENINVDLMHSFPGQTLSEIRDDLHILVGFGSEHVSLYTLTIEENSRFFAQKLPEQDGHAQGEQYQAVVSFLEESGWRQYEVSNFARPGFESEHNRNYWRGGNYVGLGVGAHSHRDGRRSWNVSRLQDFMTRMKDGRGAEEGAEELTPAQRLREALVFGLRMSDGVDLHALEERFFCRLEEETTARILEFVKNGLLMQRKRRLYATREGRLALDAISSDLI